VKPCGLFCGYLREKMQKILILTYYWPPSGGAGVQRWLKFIKYLPEFGFEPIVLTVDPAYASYPQKDESLLTEISPNCKVYTTKTFELYNIYKLFSGKKEIPYGGFANEKEPGLIQKVIRILRSHLFIPDPRKGWNKYAYRKAVELINEYGIDTVITTSPPHSTQLIGLRLKKNHNIRWVVDMRDPWTDIFYYKSLYHSWFSSSIDKALEKKVLKNADAIITVSSALKEIFSRKIGEISSPKIHVIPNGFDTDDFNHKIAVDNKEFLITYTGTLSNDYKTDVFIRVVKELTEEGYPIKLRFIGKFPQSLMDAINTLKLDESVEFMGYVPHDLSVRYMMQSNALLLIIPDVSENKGILTGKLFEYIGSERPVIGIGPVDCDAAAILSDTRCGKMHAYTDDIGLKETIRNLFISYLEKKPSVIPMNTQRFSRYELTRSLSEILKK
jgi:glycosyltransferase involved in cell wall biosynthesis